MRGIILTARPDLEVNRRLVEAGRSLGVELEIVDGTRAVARAGGSGASVEGAGEPGVVVPRIGNWRPASLLAVLEALESSGWWSPNPAAAVRVGRDHWRTVLHLARAGLPVPESVAGAEPETLAAAGARLGFPVVVKQRRSRMGVGVVRCDDRAHLEAVLDSLWRLGDEVVVQAWVPSGGRSHRLLIAGGKVVAAAAFEAGPGEWRSNAARGGRAAPLEPSAEERFLAQSAADALGLGICGVDILPGPDGPVVVEVNPSPGFRHLEAATETDVAAALVEALVSMAPPGRR